jgi:hypothetical protein
MLYSLLFILLYAHHSNSSHFKGETIMWKPVLINSSMAIVDITVKSAWRRNYNYYMWCNQSSILNGSSPLGESGLYVYPATFLKPFPGVYCTEYSVEENWSYGEITVTVKYAYPYAEANYTIGYSNGAAWQSVLNYGGIYYLSSLVSLKIQNHTKAINQSPITSVWPSLKIPVGIYQELNIPVMDADSDIIRCRWASGNECGDSCSRPPNVTLDETNCILKFNLPSTIGFYALRLQIEDFESKTSLVAMSSVPLQFLVEAYKLVNSSITPTFVSPTKADKTCVTITLGSTYTDVIVVDSNSINSSISEIQTISPPGLLKSDLYSFSNRPTIKYVNVTWTPTKYGVYLFCFVAITKSKTKTEQRCVSLVSLLVGSTIPYLLQNTSIPTGTISTYQTEWSITTDQNILRPVNDTFIKFYDYETRTLVYKVNMKNVTEVEIIGQNIVFYTAQFLEDNKNYYINFDRGVIQGSLGCELQSEEITGRDFWTFSVKNCENCENGKCVGINECECDLNWSGVSCDMPCVEDCYKFNCLCIILTLIICLLIIVIFAFLICFKRPTNQAVADVVFMKTNNPKLVESATKIRKQANYLGRKLTVL